MRFGWSVHPVNRNVARLLHLVLGSVSRLLVDALLIRVSSATPRVNVSPHAKDLLSIYDVNYIY